MRQPTFNFLHASWLALGLVVVASVPAEESALPSEPQAQTPTAEAVQPKVDKKATDEALEKRKQIIAEATAAIRETKKALKALEVEDKKPDEALKALETATGKLELILARDPELALAPVDVTVVTHDLLVDLDTVRKAI